MRVKMNAPIGVTIAAIEWIATPYKAKMVLKASAESILLPRVGSSRPLICFIMEWLRSKLMPNMCMTVPATDSERNVVRKINAIHWCLFSLSREKLMDFWESQCETSNSVIALVGGKM